MRQFLALAAAFSLAATAAHAQFFRHGPYPHAPSQFAGAPKNPYALPAPPKPTHPPSMFQPAPKPFEAFKPFKPMTHVNPDEDSSGYYPELHRKPRRHPAGGF